MRTGGDIVGGHMYPRDKDIGERMSHRPLDSRDGSEGCGVSLILVWRLGLSRKVRMEGKVPLVQCSQSQHEALCLNSGTEGTNPQLRYLNIVSSGFLPNEDPGTVLQRSREEPVRQSCSL